MNPEHEALIELAHAKMPFGKYAGRYLTDLPETYVLWFKGKGYPSGKLGDQLRAMEEIKTNGLEELIRTIRERASAPVNLQHQSGGQGGLGS